LRLGFIFVILMPALECKSGGRATVNKVVCPVCSSEIRPVSFGDGIVWVCCGKVVNSVSRRDQVRKQETQDDSNAEGSKE
jgi:hypothetical protein